MIALHEEDFRLILVMLIQMTLLVEAIRDFSSISHLGMECEDDLLPDKTVYIFFLLFNRSHYLGHLACCCCHRLH